MQKKRMFSMNEEYNNDEEKQKKSKNDKNRAPLSYRDTTDFDFLMQNFPYGFYLHTYTCTHTQTEIEKEK